MIIWEEHFQLSIDITMDEIVKEYSFNDGKVLLYTTYVKVVLLHQPIFIIDIRRFTYNEVNGYHPVDLVEDCWIEHSRIIDMVQNDYYTI